MTAARRVLAAPSVANGRAVAAARGVAAEAVGSCVVVYFTHIDSCGDGDTSDTSGASRWRTRHGESLVRVVIDNAAPSVPLALEDVEMEDEVDEEGEAANSIHAITLVTDRDNDASLLLVTASHNELRFWNVDDALALDVVPESSSASWKKQQREMLGPVVRETALRASLCVPHDAHVTAITTAIVCDAVTHSNSSDETYRIVLLYGTREGVVGELEVPSGAVRNGGAGRLDDIIANGVSSASVLVAQEFGSDVHTDTQVGIGIADHVDIGHGAVVDIDTTRLSSEGGCSRSFAAITSADGSVSLLQRDPRSRTWVHCNNVSATGRDDAHITDQVVTDLSFHPRQGRYLLAHVVASNGVHKTNVRDVLSIAKLINTDSNTAMNAGCNADGGAVQTAALEWCRVRLDEAAEDTRDFFFAVSSLCWCGGGKNSHQTHAEESALTLCILIGLQNGSLYQCLLSREEQNGCLTTKVDKDEDACAADAYAERLVLRIMRRISSYGPSAIRIMLPLEYHHHAMTTTVSQSAGVPCPDNDDNDKRSLLFIGRADRSTACIDIDTRKSDDAENAVPLWEAFGLGGAVVAMQSVAFERSMPHANLLAVSCLDSTLHFIHLGREWAKAAMTSPTHSGIQTLGDAYHGLNASAGERKSLLTSSCMTSTSYSSTESCCFDEGLTLGMSDGSLRHLDCDGSCVSMRTSTVPQEHGDALMRIVCVQNVPLVLRGEEVKSATLALTEGGAMFVWLDNCRHRIVIDESVGSDNESTVRDEKMCITNFHCTDDIAREYAPSNLSPTDGPLLAIASTHGVCFCTLESAILENTVESSLLAQSPLSFTLKAYAVETEYPLTRLFDGRRCTCLRWSPKQADCAHPLDRRDNLLAIGFSDGYVAVVRHGCSEFNTFTVAMELFVHRTVVGKNKAITALAWHHDSRDLLAVSSLFGDVEVWSLSAEDNPQCVDPENVIIVSPTVVASVPCFKANIITSICWWSPPCAPPANGAHDDDGEGGENSIIVGLDSGVVYIVSINAFRRRQYCESFLRSLQQSSETNASSQWPLKHLDPSIWKELRSVENTNGNVKRTTNKKHRRRSRPHTEDSGSIA